VSRLAWRNTEVPRWRLGFGGTWTNRYKQVMQPFKYKFQVARHVISAVHAPKAHGRCRMLASSVCYSKSPKTSENSLSDLISVSGLQVCVACGGDAWEHKGKQPLKLNISLHTDISNAGDSDVLAQSTSYSDVASRIHDHVEKQEYRNVQGLANDVAQMCIDEYGVEKVSVCVEKPRGLLHASSAGVKLVKSASEPSAEPSVFIKDLTLHTIVGIHPWERKERQKVIISLEMQTNQSYKFFSKVVTEYVETSDYQTVEALATSIARICIEAGASNVHLRLEKPSALLFADAAVIEISRHATTVGHITAKQNFNHIAYIALGSNMGNRQAHIADALHLLGKVCRILDTSFLYESAPMYVQDQDLFLNGACKVSTTLSPHELLIQLKKIEQDIGRRPSIRNGPRTVDLDIVFYDDIELKTPDLEIPHPRMAEREFVLRPMADIAQELEHPTLFRSVGGLLNIVKENQVYRVMPIGDAVWKWDKTYIMGILNVTPDSFSDGGKFNSLDAAVFRAKEMVEQGADIIDIGGMSTRPNSEEITLEEELERVIPVIKAIRSAGLHIPISIDTFRARVAREAVAAGANFINDVSGAERDEDMFQAMANTQVPVCLMHMRGDSKTMTSLTDYKEGVVKHVAASLSNRVEQALQHGIHRWNIILDPGIGFAKNASQNVELLRHLPLVKANMPMLVGVSRKAFLGRLTGQDDPEKRVFATAAACSAAIAGGADILRVHDVEAIKNVAQVYDALTSK
jgi:dihydroneopterin aldolase/2-amino-4-hydroxy-6-hydroxymethyldihydropteridine diphosphokinase/dihydropteroate synthase